MTYSFPYPSSRSATIARRRRRSGIALAIAIMSVVLIAAMVAGASYFAMQNGRAADNSRRIVQAASVVEAATADVIHNWTPARYNSLAKGSAVTIADTVSPQGRGRYQGSVTKLSDQTFMIDLTATDSAGSRLRGGGARQRLATLVRIVPLQLPTTAALTIANAVVFGGGNSIVAGADQVPPGWAGSCPPAGATVPGVRAKAAGDIQGSNGQYTGNPNSLITPGLDSTAYTRFGNITYDQLALSATFTLTPGFYSPSPLVNAGDCVTNNPTNWGDGSNPGGVCGQFFPTVHIGGGAGSSTTLSSGQGQGMLLVDGDLVVSGTWTYYGILIVKGTFKTTGVGAPKVFGTVLAKAVDFSSTSSGNAAAVINYSACSMSRSMNATSRASTARSRSYVRVI
ncbi:hypothetical protein BH11GEM1_BH11GEM1_02210 [soil metagenome]